MAVALPSPRWMVKPRCSLRGKVGSPGCSVKSSAPVPVGLAALEVARLEGTIEGVLLIDDLTDRQREDYERLRDRELPVIDPVIADEGEG